MSDFNAPFADDASQASRSSLSGSLLDRIRAQREKETGSVQPEPLTLPSYAPVETTTTTEPATSASGLWSMGDFNLPRFGGNTEATTSLLGEEEGGEGYSMQGYAHTFVQDVYNAFRSIHPVAQGTIVVVLFMIAIKLLLWGWFWERNMYICPLALFFDFKKERREDNIIYYLLYTPNLFGATGNWEVDPFSWFNVISIIKFKMYV
jgi:hypothetical protein